ncbi:hypothetical protein [Methylobacterium oryzihabitans]|uniref:Uncharacterized protein n=1 Tax=Methylobacterium oryzihabitans TaxID=2499852 RepID=A0A437P3L6_9HYPH|nr:hypothetical protein [Methylobacterium oryzihabitans]RVU16835.1 hypothetical protein EOE48_15320 [Methylobacterium oryzihabitans]
MSVPVTFEDDVEARVNALELVVVAMMRELARRDPAVRDGLLAEVRRAATDVDPPTPKTEAMQAKALALAEIILSP